jgi:hypothetical protein
MKTAFIFILTCVFFYSCQSGDDTRSINSIDYTLISQDNLYGSGNESIDPQNMIIDNELSWTLLLSKMNSNTNVSDQFTEVDIDFTKYNVLAFFDEIRPNGGFSVDLNFSIKGEKIIAEVVKSSPEGNATTVITQPYIIVKIEKSNLLIEFE